MAEEIVTVTFKNYLANYLRYVMAGSISLDIEVVDLNTFFVENREQFGTYKLYTWPIWYDGTNELEQYLQKNNNKCYVISVSLGLTSYAFAKAHKIKKKR